MRPRRNGRGRAAAEAVRALWLLAAASAAVAQQAPEPAPEAAPTPGIGRWLDPATAPFIPIPEVDLDPQSGATLGVIATFLDVSKQGDIERITAPDVFHTQYFGWGTGISVYGFPSEDAQWLVVGSVKQQVEHELDARYLGGQTRATPLSWSIEAIDDRSGTARFFGIGNETPNHNESTYVRDRTSLAGSIGYNFTQATQLAYGARWRGIDVLPGVLPGVPSIETLYPKVNGLGSEHALEQTLTVTHDTRDSPNIPRSGARYLIYGGFASHSLGSSVAYSFFGAEARWFLPLGEHITFAAHLSGRYMPSAAEAPFWALSSLGGDRSITNGREPLRSDGADRYVDQNLIATGAELRMNVGGFSAFRTRVHLELAPFIDAGKVFSSGPGNVFSEMHTAAGMGVRGVASPYVVGYVDVGYGRGNAVVFSGINYPF
ncbi:MAG: BamA/TamA family outer membrane protein [Gammaproteobacteria bacterium]|nr:BamA/TamA family outer membrane protein [Gammaproteobacteria bacterium]